MPRPYSLDFRKLVVNLVEEGHGADEVAKLVGASRAWVYRLMQRYREEGTFAAKPMGYKTPQKLAGHIGKLRELVDADSDATLEELRDKLPVKVSIGALFNTLRREGITLKKSRLRV